MTPRPQSLALLSSAFADYQRSWPAEASKTAHFIALLDAGEDPFRRERLSGHFTASVWLVSADNDRVLLTHHRKLGIWLQLGGHADGESNLQRAALKEAEEESGLTDLRIEPCIFDLDRHRIPEHKGVPEHWHYDVRFVVRAGASESYVVSDESHDLAWRNIEQLASQPDADASLRRMAGKWLARQAGA